MSEPELRMKSELLEKLRYSDLTGVVGLSESELTLLRGDHRLRQELQLNQALWKSRFAELQVPAVEGQVSLALERIPEMDATQEDSGIMRSLLAGRKWYWQAAAVLAVAVIVLGIAALWPWRVSVSPGGINVAQETAWATVDGFVLDYIVTFTDLYTGTAEDSAEHPLWRMQAIVDDWAKGNAGRLDPGNGQVPVEFKIENGQAQPKDRVVYADGSGKEFVYTIHLTVPTGDRGLVDGLAAELGAFGEVSNLKMYSRQWFYSEKYPELRYEGREVFINGLSLAYPHDVNEENLSLMGFILNIMPNEDGWVYLALDDTEEFRRVGLDDVARVSWEDDGCINIESTGHELNFTELGLPSWVHWMMMYVPAGETHLELDIVDLLRKNAVRQHRPYVNEFKPKGQLVIVDLLPRELWLGKTTEELPRSAGLPSTNQINKQIIELESTLAKLLKDYPDAEDLLATKPVLVGEVPVQWVVRATGTYYESFAQLVGQNLSEQTGLVVKVIPDMTEVGFIAVGEEPQVETKEAIPGIKVHTNIMIELLPIKDEHGRDEHLAVKRASQATLRKAQKAGNHLKDLVSQWNQQLPKDGPAPVVVDLHKVEDTPYTAWIMFDEDSEFVDDLANTLKDAGYEDVKINRSGPNSRLTASTQTLYVRFFEPIRFVGLAAEDVADEFSSEEQVWVAELSAAIRSAVTIFSSDQAEEVDRDELEALTTLGYAVKYGDMTIGFNIALLDNEPGALEELHGELAEAGLPRTGDAEPWFYYLYDRAEQHEGRWQRNGYDWQKTVIWYHLPYADRAHLCAPEFVDSIYTDEERKNAADLQARMQAVLDSWLDGKPDDLEVTLVTNEQSSIISQIYVNSNKNDEDTVLALGEALDVEGAPVYQYGTGFLNRHVPGHGGTKLERREFKMTQISWSVLPQVRFMAAIAGEKTQENLRNEFTAEEVEGAYEDAMKIKQALADWVELHPDLKEPVTPELERLLKAYMFPLPDPDEVVYHVNVNLYEEDDARIKELVVELAAMVKAAGVEVNHHTFTHNQSLSVSKQE